MTKDSIQRGKDNHLPSRNSSSFSGAHDYFSNSVLPQNIHARIRRITAPTSYINNQEQVFLLIQSGNGRICVNGLQYDIKPNTLIYLGPFHRYRLLPAKSDELQVAEARIHSSTYVYMIANPYLKYEHMTVPSEPPVAYLKGLSAEIANDSMNALLHEIENDSKDSIHFCFCYIMDFFGLITDHVPKRYLYSAEKE